MTDILLLVIQVRTDLLHVCASSAEALAAVCSALFFEGCFYSEQP
jgi:hypothetical protein